MTRTVLVTGGAGYVGSHIAKRLASAGFLPVVLDDLSRGHRDFVRWGPLEEADLGDEAALDRILLRHRPAAILHLAALTYVGESATAPERYYATNVGGSLALLGAARRAGIAHIVFTSTCATYGGVAAGPLAEGVLQDPQSPYGRSKLIVEQVLADFGRAHGLRWVVLRPFNACGADADGEVGEDHDPETHLVPLALSVAAGRRPSIDVMGDRHPTADGTCIRDYVHVSDLAEAHLLAVEHLLAGGGSDDFNIGTGRGHSVREVIAAAERITGRAIPIRVAAARPGDPPALVADVRKAGRVLGFRARLGLDDAIASAWRWHNRQIPPIERRYHDTSALTC